MHKPRYASYSLSRRHRAGSRRNKRMRNVGTFITDLTHAQRYGCQTIHLCVQYYGQKVQPPMAMMVSRADRAWVDRVRTGMDYATPLHNHALVIEGPPPQSVLARVAAGVRRLGRVTY